MWHNNILETIGNTPLVKLNKIVKNIPATVLAKVETFNPGNSIKDRMAIKMIEDAEKNGLLKPVAPSSKALRVTQVWVWPSLR
jgi:cystathionine beta-synthase